MPLRFDIRRVFSTRSSRVKCTDLHPTEPWMLASLFDGNLHVWNYESQQLIKSFEVCEMPVRAGQFVVRKNWVVSGSDDMCIRVYNYNTLERVECFEAHADFVRCITVHPTRPYLLTSGDDMLIKLWDWDKRWTCAQVFEGHNHYVMQVVINPKDNNTFASASLDRTIKIWQLGSAVPNFTLEGHKNGVNCISYYTGGDKPYLISGADDQAAKIWDYQNKSCVHTLEGHTNNVTCVSFHPELPIVLTGSEDGTVRMWHSNTYRLLNTLNYGLERVWTVKCQQGSNVVALGCDEGSIVLKLGREEPAMSMDISGKIILSKHSELQQANIKALADTEVKDGDRLPLAIKDMGSCEIYPQSISHNPNGRFVVVCGDGEYIIYTAMALRSKSYGSAQEFVWASDSSMYAIRENSMLKISKNFKEQRSFKPDFGADGIYGGYLLGVRSVSGLAFYDWETTDLVRRIEITPKHIFWNDSSELLCIACDDTFYILKYNPEALDQARTSDDGVGEDGAENAFDMLGEVEDMVQTGCWVGDCFIFTDNINRLKYYVGGEIVTVAHLDRIMYLLGYIPKDNRLYLGDKELNVVSYSLLLSVLEYQTAVMRRDFETADRVLPTIPKDQRTRIALFLEKQGFKSQALAVTGDAEHKFDLALSLGDLKIAHELAIESKSPTKWKQLADLATARCQFDLVRECLDQAEDFGGMVLLATATGDAETMDKLARMSLAGEQNNVAFMSNFVLGRLEECLELLLNTGRIPEAAFFARTYLPSQVSKVVQLWRGSLAKNNPKTAQALADPTEYENLFDGMKDAYKTEEYLSPKRRVLLPANSYIDTVPNQERNVVEEMKQAEKEGLFISQLVKDEDDEVADEDGEEDEEEEEEEIEEIEIEEEEDEEEDDDVSPVDEDDLEIDLEGVEIDEDIDTSVS